MFRTIAVNGVSKIYLNEPGNDLWIREVIFPNKKNGYFVEAGAADGVSDSSCFFLEKQMGWRGICIEPHDQFFPQLIKNRPNSIHVNKCLANSGGVVDFAVSSNGINPFVSGVREVLAAHKWGGGLVLANAEIVPKTSATLAEILREHKAPNEIDYGAFDIEGSEFEAMRSFPFDEYRFLALSFELDDATRGPLARLLADYDYCETTNPFNKNCPWERYWLHRSIADKHPR